MMILPFLTFGRGVKSNYLYNLDSTDGNVDVPIIIAFVFASLSVSISYVLQVQPVRRSVVSLIYGSRPLEGKQERSVRVAVVSCLLLITYGLAVGIGDDLSLPINIAGLLGGNTMCFVMPFLLYLQHLRSEPAAAPCGTTSGRRRHMTTVMVMVTLVFCLCLYPLCLSGIVYEAINK